MHTFFKRLNHIFENEGFKNLNDFALNGLKYDSSSKLSRLKDDKNKPSVEILLDISNKFQHINLHWLLTGEGNMLIEDGTQIVKGSEYPIHDNADKVEEPPITMKRDEEFLEMQRELIRSQKDQISCYKELLSELKKEHTDYVPGLDVSRQELKK